MYIGVSFTRSIYASIGARFRDGQYFGTLLLFILYLQHLDPLKLGLQPAKEHELGPRRKTLKQPPTSVSFGRRTACLWYCNLLLYACWAAFLQLFGDLNGCRMSHLHYNTGMKVLYFLIGRCNYFRRYVYLFVRAYWCDYVHDDVRMRNHHYVRMRV